MHEISLVRNIFRTLENEFLNRFDRITKIYLTVGELSNIQPILMQNAFDAILESEPKYKNKKLDIQVLPIKIYCEHCKKESLVKQYRFICNTCKQASAKVVQGEELLISKVEFSE